MNSDEKIHVLKALSRSVFCSVFLSLLTVAVLFEPMSTNQKLIAFAAIALFVITYRTVLDVAGKLLDALHKVEKSAQATFLSVETARLNPADQSSVTEAMEAGDRNEIRGSLTFQAAATFIVFESALFVFGAAFFLYVIYANYPVILNFVYKLSTVLR